MTPTTWTLEPADDGDWTLYKHDEYPRGSVLAGSPRRSLVCWYGSIAEAVEDRPEIASELQITRGSTKIEHTMSPCPPADFCPGAANERW